MNNEDRTVIVHDLLLEIFQATKCFLDSGLKIRSYLEYENLTLSSSPGYLAQLLKKFAIHEGKFTFPTSEQTSERSGTSVRYIRVAEACDCMNNAVSKFLNRADLESEKYVYSVECILFDLLSVLELPALLKEIQKLEKEFAQFKTSLKTSYPALMNKFPFMVDEFTKPGEDELVDLQDVVEPSEAVLQKVSNFLCLLNGVVKSKLERLTLDQ